MGEEITITYETLFDLVRREKNREELQKLDAKFFNDVAAYLRDKIALMDSQKADLFSDTEREKAAIQIQNIKKLIRELYERRERKIINMALIKARTEGTLLDTSSLLDQEQALFVDLNNVILKHRLELLSTLINQNKVINIPVQQQGQQDIQPGEDEESASVEPQQTGFEQLTTVRFLNAVPQFVGKSLEVYGPFEEDDMARLPKDIAEILVQKGRAELFDNNDQARVS